MLRHSIVLQTVLLQAPSAKANNFKSALAEACFMTGLERNADVVRLAT
ncbi:MAG: hypothetical protein IIX85_06555, partial [Clostridia bacterium]|nr:hypothetical protein [Clostridia bacterium]